MKQTQKEMKHYILDNHTGPCLANTERFKDKDDWSRSLSLICETNPERFLFFLGNEFILITYYKCNEHTLYHNNHIDFKLYLIKTIIDDYKVFNYYDIFKSYQIDQELKDFRLRGKALKKYVQNINYKYNTAAGKEYCITTKANFLDKICDNEIVTKNYKEAKEYLKEIGLEYLIEELTDLYADNLYPVCNYEVAKTTEHLIKLINQQIA